MPTTGAWLSYLPDLSEMALNSSELAAYRHGNGRSFTVVFWPYGQTLAEVLEAPPAAPVVAAPVVKDPKVASKAGPDKPEKAAVEKAVR